MHRHYITAAVAAAAVAHAFQSPAGTLAEPEPTVHVYFGCGCFWHVQHEFVTLEMSAFGRHGEDITARASYAGSSRTGSGGLVCYHNWEGVADYGQLGHTEVVSLTVPKANFSLAAERFWATCPGGQRRDVQDVGGEYRTAVGLPGGMASPLLPQLQAGAGSATLVAAQGEEGDTLDTGRVLVYDTATFPAHVAEKYHQFHDDMIDQYGPSYHALAQYAQPTSCPGDTGFQKGFTSFGT